MTGWRRDRTGVQPGGDVGGDIQATESYSVRYTRPDQPGAIVTVYFYGIDRTVCGCAVKAAARYGVEEQTELLLCTDPRDPGGTETWSEASYRLADHTFFPTPEEADRRARRLAQRHSALGFTWDGRPPWEDRQIRG